MTLMKSCSLVATLVSLCACTAGREVTEAPGPFGSAARSWVGASVDEMIAVWGPPQGLLNAKGGDEPGFAHWRSGQRSSGSPGASQTRTSRCAIDAYFQQDRIIRRVEVSGRKCDERYAERIDLLTR